MRLPAQAPAHDRTAGPLTTDQKIAAFIAGDPFRTVAEETAFIRELTLPWMGKEPWWLRRNLTKRERSFVAYIKALDARSAP